MTSSKRLRRDIVIPMLTCRELAESRQAFAGGGDPI